MLVSGRTWTCTFILPEKQTKFIQISFQLYVLFWRFLYVLSNFYRCYDFGLTIYLWLNSVKLGISVFFIFILNFFSQRYFLNRIGLGLGYYGNNAVNFCAFHILLICNLALGIDMSKWSGME